MPSVQHTLGKKNQTFHLLGASATALIEQEADLINALGRVCRGLRGEGFEWRWEGDDGRRQAKKDAAKDEEERKDGGKEPAQDSPATPAPGASTDPQNVSVADTTALESTSDAVTNPAVADLRGEDVKVEQATPVLQSAVAPAPTSTESQVAVPGVGGADNTNGEGDAQEDTEMQSATDDNARAEVTPALSEAPSGNGAVAAQPTLLSHGSAVTAAVLAQGVDSGGGGSAPPPSAKEVTEGPAGDARSSAPPSTTAAADGENGAGLVPAIAVTGPGTTGLATETTGTGGEGPAAKTTTTAGEKPADTEADDAGTVEGTPAPSTAGGDDVSAPAAAATTSSSTTTAAAAAAASRRRSGRVPAASRGAVRHTRSRQSSPEDEGVYSSGGEDDTFLYDDEAEPAAQRRGGAGAAPAGAGARAQLVPEEELPEYAERMIDPEGYVRSLFVTEDKVELERLVPAPTGGMVGTGQFDS